MDNVEFVRQDIVYVYGGVGRHSDGPRVALRAASCKGNHQPCNQILVADNCLFQKHDCTPQFLCTFIALTQNTAGARVNEFAFEDGEVQ